MIDNRQLTRELFATNGIAVEDGAILHSEPAPVSSHRTWDRVEGMLLGLAIGDSLGNTTEGKVPSVRKAAHGEIRDYLPNMYAAQQCVGVPSDDTQLAYWTLEQLLEDDGLNPEHLATRFAADRIYGIGRTMREFLRRHTVEGLSWTQAGDASAGNGALMRIAPVLLPHLRAPSSALWADTLLASMITHNDRGSNAACIAFVAML